MKFLYVAPRFHTNQVPIIEGLIEKGHEVRFLVNHVGSTEKHSGILVDVMPDSHLSRLVYKIHSKKGKDIADHKRIFWFSPQKSAVSRILKEYSPDVIIVRERNIFSLKVYWIAKHHGIKNVILYNQSPAYREKGKEKNALVKKIVRVFFPKKRITVCKYHKYPELNKEYIIEKNTFLLHFIPRSFQGIRRERQSNEPLRILDIGKYREYKNHYVLMRAAKELLARGLTNFKISVYGQLETNEEKKYHAELVCYIQKNGLSEYVELHGAVSYDEVGLLFLSNDVFVLTSKRELANISILDAASFGTVAVATDNNGTSDYIKDNETGLIFKTDDEFDLSLKLEMLMNDEVLLCHLRDEGMKDMRDNYGFDSYYKKLLSVINCR